MTGCAIHRLLSCDVPFDGDDTFHGDVLAGDPRWCAARVRAECLRECGGIHSTDGLRDLIGSYKLHAHRRDNRDSEYQASRGCVELYPGARHAIQCSELQPHRRLVVHLVELPVQYDCRADAPCFLHIADRLGEDLRLGDDLFLSARIKNYGEAAAKQLVSFSTGAEQHIGAATIDWQNRARRRPEAGADRRALVSRCQIPPRTVSSSRTCNSRADAKRTEGARQTWQRPNRVPRTHMARGAPAARFELVSRLRARGIRRL